MSTEQRPRTAFDAPDDPDPEPEPPVVKSRPTDGESDATSCLGCGSHVTDRYRRVRGNNDDRVFECPNCSEDGQDERAIAGLDNGHEIGGGASR